MLVYVEYISRRPGVALEAFHEVAGRGQNQWAVEYGEDRFLLNLGRTWRLGPEPEYLHVWYNPDRGLDRIDDWERIFTSGAVDSFEEPFRLAARIDAAGCYEPLLEPVPGRGGPYFAEYFDVAQGVTTDQIRAYFESRRTHHTGLTLHLVADRIGRLGPEPRGLAIWGLPSFAALDGIARELDGVDHPIRAVHAGVYADFGKEIL